MGAKEERERSLAISGLISELREASRVMEARAPGRPAVLIPLDSIITFNAEDGELQAVILVDQVIRLAGEVLRSAKP